MSLNFKRVAGYAVFFFIVLVVAWEISMVLAYGHL